MESEDNPATGVVDEMDDAHRELGDLFTSTFDEPVLERLLTSVGVHPDDMVTLCIGPAGIGFISFED